MISEIVGGSLNHSDPPELAEGLGMAPRTDSSTIPKLPGCVTIRPGRA
jgi:hypothetical protein